MAIFGGDKAVIKGGRKRVLPGFIRLKNSLVEKNDQECARLADRICCPSDYLQLVAPREMRRWNTGTLLNALLDVRRRI
jgi:hypothetical protein